MPYANTQTRQVDINITPEQILSIVVQIRSCPKRQDSRKSHEEIWPLLENWSDTSLISRNKTRVVDMSWERNLGPSVSKNKQKKIAQGFKFETRPNSFWYGNEKVPLSLRPLFALRALQCRITWRRQIGDNFTGQFSPFLRTIWLCTYVLISPQTSSYLRNDVHLWTWVHEAPQPLHFSRLSRGYQKKKMAVCSSSLFDREAFFLFTLPFQ